MDTAEEAADYDAMDHGAVNGAFCDDFVTFAGATLAAGTSILDVGTGTALIPITLCTKTTGVEIVGIDLAEHMLDLGRKNVAARGLADRIQLRNVDAKAMPFRDAEFRGVISNSIVHHIPEPLSVLAEMHRVAASGAAIFVRDLVRPDSEAEVDRLVRLYGGEPPGEEGVRDSWDRQRALFRDSLKAALTLDEVRALAKGAGMANADLRLTSDRHWTLAYVKA